MDDRPWQPRSRYPVHKADGAHLEKGRWALHIRELAALNASMDEERTEAEHPSITIGQGNVTPLRDWVRSNLDPRVYSVLYGGGADPHLQGRDHILARITPREWLFIDHVCRHPEQTDEEIRAALGLKERTVLAYYAHLGRNFKVRNSVELRRWAFKERLLLAEEDEVPPPDAPPEEPPTLRFDPWLRWY